MYRDCDAVVSGNTVYVMDGTQGSGKIYSYDVAIDMWSKLPDCVYRNSSITVISCWLTTIGGTSYPIYSNELFSLTGEGSDRKWTKKFPSMPTKRQWTTVVRTGTTLIVAGGEGEIDRMLSTVEVMDTESHQWSTVANLPEPMYLASATVCGGKVYMLGGANKTYRYSKSVYACSLSDLLQPCVSRSLLANLKTTQQTHKAGVWTQIADLPVDGSTCEAFQDRLLAVGGDMDSWKSTTAVYMYNSTTNSWEIISHMTTGRHRCFTVVLPGNQLMVMGGETDRLRSKIDTVEVASV